jgi:nucleoside-diphosphate-sugar epimerase
MLDSHKQINVITAGNTGLIGNELTKQLLDSENLEHLYVLSRAQLPFFHPKLEVFESPQLYAPEWDESKPKPDYGFICLGTTKRQFESAYAFEQIDIELVYNVAKIMKRLGVTKLAVVSSYGASKMSFSHYLRCKGRMEEKVASLGFSKLVFVRPGPLKGLREKTRRDEMLIQKITKCIEPLMIGPLANLIPIDADDVASAMQKSLFEPDALYSNTLNSVAMRHMLQDT